MLGNDVTVKLRDPDEIKNGELRRQTIEGVWIYGAWAEQAAVSFYPQHRIVEIVDNGRRWR
jgi:hypothetical protein